MGVVAKVYFLMGQVYEKEFEERISARVYARRIATDGFWLDENTLILPTMLEKVEISGGEIDES